MYPFMNPKKTFAIKHSSKVGIMFGAVQTSGRGETKLGISQTDERSRLKYVINDLYSY